MIYRKNFLKNFDVINPKSETNLTNCTESD